LIRNFQSLQNHVGGSRQNPTATKDLSYHQVYK
jgi:hypothetical protein